MSQDWQGPSKRLDWIFLLLSFTKVIELALLIRLGSLAIGVASSLPWAYTMVSALVLQSRHITRGFEKTLPTGDVDILAGDLPNMYSGGSGAKVLLGAPRNFRHHELWTAFWAIGAVTFVASLVTLYASLRQSTSSAILLWLGFQLLWLLARSVVFQLLEATDTEYTMSGPGRSTQAITPGTDVHGRLLGLLQALILYQDRFMTRSEHDLKETREVARILELPTYQFHNLFSAQSVPVGGTIDIEIHAVIGDSVLRSGAWLGGIKLSGIEPNENEGVHSYDCAVVILNDRLHNLCAYPAVRAACGPDQSQPVGDNPAAAETGSTVVRQYFPRGAVATPQSGTVPQKHRWFYWLPRSDGTWLQVVWEKGEQLGRRNGTVTTDEMFTALLEGRTLQIGEWSVDEAKRGVGNTKVLFKALTKLLTGNELQI